MDSFDHVIVGGGTAAGVLALRLAEHGRSVCVLEAGPADTNPYIRVPAGWFKTLPDPDLTWQLRYEGSPGTNGRVTPLVAGKTLGGSSAVNGAVYNRGQAADFDLWAQQGNPGWSYADILPYFQKNERYSDDGDNRFRGRAGPLPVSRTKWRDVVGERFIAGANLTGIPSGADYNGEDQAGAHYIQSAVDRNNRRWSTAHAYLHPAARRHGARVITRACATQIILEQGRATGVRYRLGDDPGEHDVRARKSVILCAGAVGSPKLLQLSGIGPAAHLRALGRAVHHDLPGVGENLQDHFVARVVTRAKSDVTSINERVRGLPLLREAAAWALGRPSVLAFGPVLIYAFWKSHPDLTNPDFALSYYPASYKAGMIGYIDDLPGLTCGAFQLRPHSRGNLRIRSGDDREAPLIQPNFLAEPTDRSVIVAALKWARNIMQSAPMRDLVESELLPGKDVRSDDEWLNYARQYGSTGYHIVGTCKMGPASDPMAVVDPALRVHGLDGLHVIDASIMPNLPSANTAAATMMLAEKGADVLKAI